MGDDYLAKARAAAAAAKETDCASDRNCWRCAAGSEPPAIEDQVELLTYEHQKRGEVFRLRDSEIARLQKLLQPGDLIAVAVNFMRVVNPTYGSIAIIRDGKLISIDRRELADG
ncbi:MAG TPA: hypothetical protein VMV27_14285 [Candidatus Binataceae bacterium]|nr:hypothetical protein [Candidatus Binataceae bacterium]